MRILITMLFIVLVSAGCSAGNESNPYYQELSPLSILIMILIPLAIFSGLVATLFISLIYSFGGRIEDLKFGGFKFRPIKVSAGWQTWLLVIFGLAALIASVLLFSPAIIIVVLIIVAVTGASIFFINRGR